MDITQESIERFVEHLESIYGSGALDTAQFLFDGLFCGDVTCISCEADYRVVGELRRRQWQRRQA